jgi:ankyrin repeat protein
MTVKSAVVVLLLASTAWAQSSDDRIYQAIRTDDLAAIRALLRDTPVDRVDADGQTPLMLAAAFGSDAAVRLLITSGANARAKTDAGLTALHLAATNAAKVRLMIDAGADVTAASSAGRTPLLIAASANGNIDVVRLLLARGANVNDADGVGITPLVAAANVNDLEVAKLLLAHGASALKTSTAEGVSTPLTGAARNGNTELVRLLLAGKADVNAIGAETGPRVKNGLITFARVTALHMAAVSGNVEAVRMLLDAGATVDPRDARGMTPLMFAIATDRPNPRLIRVLLQAGASSSLESLAGETAVDWARKFNHPAVLSELKLPPAVAVASKPRPMPAAAVNVVTVTPQQAVEKSLPLLRTTGARMMADGGCVACHAQPVVGMAVNMARAKGWTIPPGPPESDTILLFLASRLPQLVQLRDAGGLPDGLLYSMFLLAGEGMAPNRTSDSVAHFLSAKQRQEGNWQGIGGTRAPIQDGDVSRTALAIRALTAYATPAPPNIACVCIARAAGSRPERRSAPKTV